MKATFRKVWGTPLLLGAVTFFGLMTALLGTGYWYWIAWMTMIVPLAVVIRKLLA